MIRRTLALLLLASSTAIAGALAFDGAMPAWTEESEDRPSRESELYDRGTKALDDGEWADAAAAFREVVRMGGSRSDGALYWVAYALAKQDRRDEALAILRGFAAQYPKSSWRKEARALELEIQPSSGKSLLQEGGDDEDLKLMAIHSLMNTEPEQAIPLLEKVLNGPSSPKLKERALFVLAQSGSPRGRQILADTARGRSGPDLQEKAIHYLGIFGGKGNGQLLSEIYASAASNEVKEKVLHAFMLSGNKERVLQAARAEKSPELRAAAVHLLGVMGARAELRDMYRTESAESVKDGILKAMFIAGDVENVLDLAKTEPNPSLRRAAIHKLGLMGGDRSASALLSIYQTDRDTELKKAVLQALFLQNNGKALVAIARSEKDPRLKAEAVSKLAIMRNKDATDYMLEILSR
ncbi:MAG: HEAT repeat domain-containing protein [Acidobacteriota bacterium]|nr:HEAT repeat domain-containing protein [Acidobacteriota bacterium]